MIKNFLSQLEKRVLAGKEITFAEAEELYHIDDNNIMPILSSASAITRKYRKDIVNLCAITAARSGLCPEDCAFCAQSMRHHTGLSVYPLISEGEMLKRAEEAQKHSANRFCIVTSGRNVNEKEIEVIARAIKKIKNKFPSLKVDASLGILKEPEIEKLKAAGLDRYNHNLETAESYFPKICTTHTYAERLSTIKLIKKAGIEICCGGIIGLGESNAQRIEFAFSLAELDIDSLPLNFLNPVPGTSLEDIQPPSPFNILKTIALFRFIIPKKEIRICGGRQVNLRSIQPFIFMAGADAIIIGNYLTTKGSEPQDDLRMLYDLGLTVDGIH